MLDSACFKFAGQQAHVIGVSLTDYDLSCLASSEWCTKLDLIHTSYSGPRIFIQNNTQDFFEGFLQTLFLSCLYNLQEIPQWLLYELSQDYFQDPSQEFNQYNLFSPKCCKTWVQDFFKNPTRNFSKEVFRNSLKKFSMKEYFQTFIGVFFYKFIQCIFHLFDLHLFKIWIRTQFSKDISRNYFKDFFKRSWWNFTDIILGISPQIYSGFQLGFL